MEIGQALAGTQRLGEMLVGFDIKGTFPFIRSNKEDLFSPATTFVFFAVRTTSTKEHSSSHHSPCPTYNALSAQGASATCVFVRREDLSVGAGVPSCEGRMGDEAAGAAKTRNGVG